MLDLRIPLDFERLPEFWQLAEALRVQAERNAIAVGKLECQADIEATALTLWVRLWVVLGYLARSTNRPGWLSAAGDRQLNAAFRQFGDDCPPVSLMTGNLLRAVEDGYQCDLFEKYNRHLAGDYVSHEQRGNIRSRLSAAKNNIAASAMMQAQLLPPDNFKKRDGTVMTQREVDRSMIVILTLDRCLKAGNRSARSYTEGLLADACTAAEVLAADKEQEFYFWLAERKDNPATPKTTEEVLIDFKRLYETSKTLKLV